jgi:hypothetical protein
MWWSIIWKLICLEENTIQADVQDIWKRIEIPDGILNAVLLEGWRLAVMVGLLPPRVTSGSAGGMRW